MENNQQKLKEAGFYKVWAFYKKTGIWTTTNVYGVMNEVHKEITGKGFDTGCGGCVTNAGETIINKYPEI